MSLDTVIIGVAILLESLHLAILPWQFQNILYLFGGPYTRFHGGLHGTAGRTGIRGFSRQHDTSAQTGFRQGL